MCVCVRALDDDEHIESLSCEPSFELKELDKSLSHDSMEGGVDVTHARAHTAELSEQRFAWVLEAP